MDYLVADRRWRSRRSRSTTSRLETDAEVNFRGVGEGGAIVAPAAVANAIEDALAPFGVTIDTFPLPPTRILELIDVLPGDA